MVRWDTFDDKLVVDKGGVVSDPESEGFVLGRELGLVDADLHYIESIL
jgi:hypothetical protein